MPGDVLIVEEGDRICADARLIDGTVEVDLSTLTGESLPVTRSAAASGPGVAAAGGPGAGVQRHAPAPAVRPQAVVTATGMRTELGRIAALSSGSAGHAARWSGRSSGWPG